MSVNLCFDFPLPVSSLGTEIFWDASVWLVMLPVVAGRFSGHDGVGWAWGLFPLGVPLAAYSSVE